MLRFHGKDLKAVLNESASRNLPVVLVKDNGVYLMVEKGRQRCGGRMKHLAYAEGCHPDLDPEWHTLARILAGGDDFIEPLSLKPTQVQDILRRDFQLAVSMTDEKVSLFTGERQFVRAVDYRNLTDRMNTLAHAHFCACRGPEELSSWRMMALNLLDEVRPVSCKRAQRRDHYVFMMAAKNLRCRAGCVSPDGALHLVSH